MSGLVASTPVWLTAQYIQEVARKALSEPNLTLSQFKVKPGSAAGDNFVCQIFRISAVLKLNGRDVDFSVIAKYNPETELMKEIIKTLDVFSIEANFFHLLQPKQLQLLKNCNDEFAPKCFTVDYSNNVIFMEDLIAGNYQLENGLLNKEKCKLIVNALAVFHGTSYYALKEKPELKNIFKNYLWSKNRDDMVCRFFKNAQREFQKHINDFDVEEKYKNLLLGFLEKLEPNWLEVGDVKEGKFNFLLHGDCWKNNIMFHYNANGQLDGMRMLDFQMVNYNSFATDIIYMLFTSTQLTVILNDIDYLLEQYFLKLREVAPDVPNLTLERVRREFDERLYFGYLVFLVYRPMIAGKVPFNIEELLEDKKLEIGVNYPDYIADLKQLLPFFEKLGIFKF